MNRGSSGLLKITARTNALFNDDKEHVSFEIRNSFFVVTIENANYKKTTINEEKVDNTLTSKERQNVILNLLNDKDRKIVELASLLKVNRKTIRQDLEKLEKLGLVAVSGTTKNKVWKLINNKEKISWFDKKILIVFLIKPYSSTKINIQKIIWGNFLIMNFFPRKKYNSSK